jgi:DNA-binding response OmpR family regulator
MRAGAWSSGYDDAMSLMATVVADRTASDTATILLYSANPALRAQVRLAVGADVAGLGVRWVEAATPGVATLEVEAGHVDLAILDAEAPKLGGMGMAKQWADELGWCPPIVLLVARTQDAWLATWSGADRAMLWPADPFALRQAVADYLPSNG